MVRMVPRSAHVKFQVKILKHVRDSARLKNPVKGLIFLKRLYLAKDLSPEAEFFIHVSKWAKEYVIKFWCCNFRSCAKYSDFAEHLTPTHEILENGSDGQNESTYQVLHENIRVCAKYTRQDNRWMKSAL